MATAWIEPDSRLLLPEYSLIQDGYCLNTAWFKKATAWIQPDSRLLLPKYSLIQEILKRLFSIIMIVSGFHIYNFDLFKFRDFLV